MQKNIPGNEGAMVRHLHFLRPFFDQTCKAAVDLLQAPESRTASRSITAGTVRVAYTIMNLTDWEGCDEK